MILSPAGLTGSTVFAASAWYYNEVQWAWANGLTVGTNDGTTFSPDNACIRAEAVEFLYNAFAEVE